VQLSLKLRRLRREGENKVRTFSDLTVEAGKVGVIISDMWDVHWCKGATERTAELAAPMEKLLQALRGMGAVIAHCPSRVASSFYDGTHARKNTLAHSNEMPEELPDVRLYLDRIVPIASLIDPHRRQCDCRPDKCAEIHPRPWKRQIETLTVFDRDLMCDDSVDGEDEFRILNAFRAMGITHVLIMGVHTNLCVIHRNFGIRRLLASGFTPILVRDMTDCMAPQEEKPYHDHFEALSEVIDYIEEYLCASVSSSQIMGGKDFRFSGDLRQSEVFGKSAPGAIPFDDKEKYDALRLALPDSMTFFTQEDGIAGISLGYGAICLPSYGKKTCGHTIPLRFGEYITGAGGSISAEGRFPSLYFSTSLGRRLESCPGKAAGKNFSFDIPKGFALSCLHGLRSAEGLLLGLGFRIRNVSLFRTASEDAARPPSNVLSLRDGAGNPFEAQWINGRFLIKRKGESLPNEGDWLPCLSPSGEPISVGMDGRYFFLRGNEAHLLESVLVLSDDGKPCSVSLFLDY
jgi:hypothetical protein